MNATTQKITSLSLLAVTIATMFAISLPTALAQTSEGEVVQGPQIAQEQRAEHKARREAVKAALEANDYEAFKVAVGDGKLSEYVTADNFNRFVALYEAFKNGDRETAEAIRAELNLPERKHHKKKHNKVSPEVRSQIKEAIKNGDYAAFQEATKDNPKIQEKITAENFAKLQELHQAIESGDTEKVRELKSELKIKPGKKRGRFQRNGNGDDRPRDQRPNFGRRFRGGQQGFGGNR